jgi:spermidine synthase
LKNAKAHFQIHLGDARIALQNELQNAGSRQDDLLVIDAFSGDAIPSHLLTKEAMQLYMSHLAKNGIIAIHTSNTYLNFLPVTIALAQQQGCSHYWITSELEPTKGLFPATWALISRDPELEQWLAMKGIKPIQSQHIDPILWTDDFNTILPLLKW